MKITLIARHYPPEISGGARRSYLMARTLREKGHSVRVVTPFPPQHKDDVQIGSISHKVSSVTQDRSAITSFKTAIVRASRYPDPDNVWAKQIISELTPDQSDWLITTSPSESVHLAGAALKAKWGDARWLAEFRDTWTHHPHRREAGRWPRRAIEQSIARKALKHADAVSAVSDAVMSEIINYLPRTGIPQHIEGHFSDTPPPAHTFPDELFNIVHSGGFSLSDHRRRLAPVLSKLSVIAKDRPDIRLHILGQLSEEEYQLCEANTWINVFTPQPLEVSRAMQAGADALLLVTPPDSHALPGKFAEYAMVGRPIITMGGGSWRKLLPKGYATYTVDDLRTLKNGTITPICDELSVESAADRLIKFLESVV